LMYNIRMNTGSWTSLLSYSSVNLNTRPKKWPNPESHFPPFFFSISLSIFVFFTAIFVFYFSFQHNSSHYISSIRNTSTRVYAQTSFSRQIRNIKQNGRPSWHEKFRRTLRRT
jgi:hypothetical protein